MRLKVKEMDISTGGALIAIMNKLDAELLDLHPLDRVKIKKGSKTETVILDISTGKAVPRGYLVLFNDPLALIGLKNEDIVELLPARKPISIDYIKKKLDGIKLNKKEIHQIVQDIVHNNLNEIELTYFVAACYSNELDIEETTLLTKAMAKYGDTLKLNRHPILDKHCVGGVAGNRTTMVIVPIIAAAGLTIPKTSSRSITSPAGTADTMDVLAKISFSIKKMAKLVKKTNGCIIWGGAINLAPADDKIIKVEKPLAIDAKSQLLASVMAKKASVSATHLLVDIPLGKGAKITSNKRAGELKRDFLEVGRRLGMRIKVITTDGTQPIGNGIGPALEARDVLWVLKNDPRAPPDLREKSLMMAGLMLEMAGKSSKLAKKILESGKAYEKMAEIIESQGEKIIDPAKIKIAKFSYDYKAKKTGTLSEINNRSICKIARVAGAPENPGSGIYLYKHVNSKVKKGEKIFTIYAHNKIKLGFAKEALEKLDGIVVK